MSNTKNEKCKRCHGSGEVAFAGTNIIDRCALCHGTGKSPLPAAGEEDEQSHQRLTLSFDYLKDRILKSPNISGEYKQVSIVILRTLYDEADAENFIDNLRTPAAFTRAPVGEAKRYRAALEVYADYSRIHPAQLTDPRDLESFNNSEENK